jgi:hypothetical protein
MQFMRLFLILLVMAALEIQPQVSPTGHHISPVRQSVA